MPHSRLRSHGISLEGIPEDDSLPSQRSMGGPWRVVATGTMLILALAAAVAWNEGGATRGGSLSMDAYYDHLLAHDAAKANGRQQKLWEGALSSSLAKQIVHTQSVTGKAKQAALSQHHEERAAAASAAAAPATAAPSTSAPSTAAEVGFIPARKAAPTGAATPELGAKVSPAAHAPKVVPAHKALKNVSVDKASRPAPSGGKLLDAIAAVKADAKEEALLSPSSEKLALAPATKDVAKQHLAAKAKAAVLKPKVVSKPKVEPESTKVQESHAVASPTKVAKAAAPQKSKASVIAKEHQPAESKAHAVSAALNSQKSEHKPKAAKTHAAAKQLSTKVKAPKKGSQEWEREQDADFFDSLGKSHVGAEQKELRKMKDRAQRRAKEHELREEREEAKVHAMDVKAREEQRNAELAAKRYTKTAFKDMDSHLTHINDDSVTGFKAMEAKELASEVERDHPNESAQQIAARAMKLLGLVMKNSNSSPSVSAVQNNVSPMGPMGVAPQVGI